MNTNNKPTRHEISPITRKIDRTMTHVIKIGGIGIIMAVFAIFIFILSQVFPLFKSANVSHLNKYTVPAGDYVSLGTDEWTERPFLLQRDGTFVFIDLTDTGSVERVRPDYAVDKTISAIDYNARAAHAVIGTSSGEFAFVEVSYKPVYKDDTRVIAPKLKVGKYHPVGKSGNSIDVIRMAVADNGRLIGIVQDVNGKPEIHAASMKQKRSLMSAGRLVFDDTYELSSLVSGNPTDLLINSRLDSVMVIRDNTTVHYLFKDDNDFESRQTFQPFSHDPEDRIASADFLYGDDSIVFTSRKGKNSVFSLYVADGESTRLFGQTKSFPELPGPVKTFSPSLRNKSFLVTGDSFASLRYSTTESVRWEATLHFAPELTAISGKFDHMLVLDNANKVHVYEIDDPHPEASFKAFFSKIWYEGANKPDYVWQSTGGTDDFEPKLSMVPLIIGTFKGTVYAMVFSVPLALLAALFTSQFASPRLKRYVKPIMEIMASLPSVILGFLAALWLAPLLETRVPSILVVSVLVPVAVIIFGNIWGNLPYSIRRRIPEGYEILAVIPLVIIFGTWGWQLGPWLESVAFVGTDLNTGQPIADFRMWWPEVTGTPFEQRNSLIVGFMMGFAVIPIIFTITEDALSNVPASFRSSSLALGASRWQTAMRVILPTASAGIFSAVMIGFGRAVGETMIVLMATGNTPIMDFNIFSGMRTLSANIAVELPEAPHHGTLYRALFLGSMLLFLMTFTVNTLAEVLRHHLREKYKAI